MLEAYSRRVEKTRIYEMTTQRPQGTCLPLQSNYLDGLPHQ